MVSPATVTTPLSGVSSRLMQRRNVLLPEPDEPRIEITSPSLAVSEIPFSTSSWPKLLCIFSTVSAGVSADMGYFLGRAKMLSNPGAGPPPPPPLPDGQQGARGPAPFGPPPRRRGGGGPRPTRWRGRRPRKVLGQRAPSHRSQLGLGRKCGDRRRSSARKPAPMI